MIPILKANGHVIYRTTGLATVTAVECDGTPAARYEVAEHPTGSLFCPPSAGIASDLISRQVATPAKLTGKTLALASAVLRASTACDAALAGLNLKGVRVWHALLGQGHLQAASSPMGATRSAFDAAFRSVSEIEAHWTDIPDSSPLFTIMTEYGFYRSYVWRGGSLREIATEVTHAGRN